MQKNKKFNFNIDEDIEILDKKFKQVYEIPVCKLKHFYKHPFKVDPNRVEQLSVDIKENGLISAIIVRKKCQEEFKILAGHHRFEAVKLAGFKTIRAEILEGISEEEAEIIVASSNFYQRSASEMLPSELARACAMFYSANKKQGRRSDLFNKIDNKDNETSHQVDGKIDTRKFVGSEFGISPSTLDRNLRLSKLCDEFLAALDIGYISSAAGVHLSFLSLNEQKVLLNCIEENRRECKTWVSMNEAEEIKLLSQNKTFNEEILLKIFNIQNHRVYKKQFFKLKLESFENYFSQEMTQEEIILEIKEALNFYKSFKEKGISDKKYPQQVLNEDGSFGYVLKRMVDGTTKWQY